MVSFLPPLVSEIVSMIRRSSNLWTPIPLIKPATRNEWPRLISGFSSCLLLIMFSLMVYSASGKNVNKSPKHLAKLTCVGRGELLNNLKIYFWIDNNWSFDDFKQGLKMPKKMIAQIEELIVIFTASLLSTSTTYFYCTFATGGGAFLYLPTGASSFFYEI